MGHKAAPCMCTGYMMMPMGTSPRVLAKLSPKYMYLCSLHQPHLEKAAEKICIKTGHWTICVFSLCTVHWENMRIIHGFSQRTYSLGAYAITVLGKDFPDLMHRQADELY